MQLPDSTSADEHKASAATGTQQQLNPGSVDVGGQDSMDAATAELVHKLQADGTPRGVFDLTSLSDNATVATRTHRTQTCIRGADGS